MTWDTFQGLAKLWIKSSRDGSILTTHTSDETIKTPTVITSGFTASDYVALDGEELLVGSTTSPLALLGACLCMFCAFHVCSQNSR